MAKKRKRALTKLTVLAYSSAELQRLSDAVEAIVIHARNIQTVFNGLDALACRLEAVAEVIDRRHMAAVKANRTRKAAAQAAAELPNGLGEPQAPGDGLGEPQAPPMANNGQFQAPTSGSSAPIPLDDDPAAW